MVQMDYEEAFYHHLLSALEAEYSDRKNYCEQNKCAIGAISAFLCLEIRKNIHMYVYKIRLKI
jgi:uncharacterized protein YqgC (DUF456 family)